VKTSRPRAAGMRTTSRSGVAFRRALTYRRSQHEERAST
jgi:hypothetical protein